MRTIVWFSCGAASAVASKIAVNKYKNVHIVYCDTHSEHEDNKRFLQDVQNWIGQKIEILGSEKYNDIWAVFEKTRWLVGVGGARCTGELKKRLREKYQKNDDIQIFGYSYEEKERAERFIKQHPDVTLLTPLIDEQITHDECIGIISEAGIEIPIMYKLGYGHNNCIGCPKGQGGYWNKIRKDFPEIFARMAKVERKLNAAICKTYAGDGERKRLFLDELPEDFGNYDLEPQMTCDMICKIKAEEINDH